MLGGELGADTVADYAGSGAISAVNLSEVLAKLVERGANPVQAQSMLSGAALEVIPFDEQQAAQAGFLRRDTRALGLSLGDRACLALAQHLGLPVLTADRAWLRLDIGIEVVLAR